MAEKISGETAEEVSFEKADNMPEFKVPERTNCQNQSNVELLSNREYPFVSMG